MSFHREKPKHTNKLPSFQVDKPKKPLIFKAFRSYSNSGIKHQLTFSDQIYDLNETSIKKEQLNTLIEKLWSQSIRQGSLDIEDFQNDQTVKPNKQPECKSFVI